MLCSNGTALTVRTIGSLPSCLESSFLHSLAAAFWRSLAHLLTEGAYQSPGRESEAWFVGSSGASPSFCWRLPAMFTVGLLHSSFPHSLASLRAQFSCPNCVNLVQVISSLPYSPRHIRISPQSAQRTRRGVHFFAYFKWRVGDEELGCGLFGDGGDDGCWRGGIRAD